VSTYAVSVMETFSAGKSKPCMRMMMMMMNQQRGVAISIIDNCFSADVPSSARFSTTQGLK
jgi:hypothetical protein